MSEHRTVLVVAAHTDDEALGCGATIRRHADRGDSIAAIHLTDGVGSRSADATDADAVDVRHDAALGSARILGFDWVAGGDFPDNALDTVPLLEVCKFIESAKRDVDPDLVYVHHGGDLNVDHRIAFQATLTAFRPQPGERCREIRTFEVASSTEWSDPDIGPRFDPQIFVDASETWLEKRRALEVYDEEMRAYPHSRSIEALDALSRWRGAQVGLERAEAFGLVRRIER